MLGRVLLAAKLDHPLSARRLAPRPCRFIPLRHSSTCIRTLAASRKRASKLPIASARRPPGHKLPQLPPRETILQLFSRFPQNSYRTGKCPSRYKHISQLGREVGMTAYELVHWPLVLRVIQSAWHNVRKSTTVLLNWRARALLETQHYTGLNAIYDLFKLNNLQPTRRTHHLVLSGYIRNHDLAGARECLRVMKVAGYPPDHSTHALIATLYQTIGPDEQVKETGIRSLPHIHTRAATHMMNSLMQLRLRIFDLDEVFNLLSAFDQRKVGPLALMLAASRTRHDETVQNPGRHREYPTIVEPDAVTFAMFIDYFADLRELPHFLSVLDHMLLAGIEPTMRTATSMIRAYFLAGHGGPAVHMIASMCNPANYLSRVVSKLLSTNGLAGAHTVLRLMRRNGVKPDSKTKAHIVLASTLRYQKFLVDGVGWDVVAARFSRARTARGKLYSDEAITTMRLPRRARQRGTFRAIEQSLVDRGIKSDRATIALRIRHDAVVKGDMNSATEIPIWRCGSSVEWSLQVSSRMFPSSMQVASAFFFTGAYPMCHRVLTSLPRRCISGPLHRGQQQGGRKTSKEFRKVLYRAIASLLKDWRVFKRKRRIGSRMRRTDLKDGK
ncbi:hypothetical protein B0H14DRAFT_2870896 [Mycena olivaceomarginata]|nr:hypothetical protein B0H14DRAFT_2870896 [Mycena olivaceomarginata]